MSSLRPSESKPADVSPNTVQMCRITPHGLSLIQIMVSTANLPVIDVHAFRHADAAASTKIAEAVVRACEEWGFFYVNRHGIPEAVLGNARRVALEFFRGPGEIKKKVHISQVPHHRGYVGHYDVSPDVQKGGDIREAYKVALELPEDDPDFLAGITMYGPNIWPQEYPEFQQHVYRLYESFLDLSADIFDLFAVGLGLPRGYFVPMAAKPASVMNVNYYPATSVSGSDTSGIGAHSDYEAFAMLWQDDVGGLQIQSLEGDWQAVQPLDGTLVINIGDLMSRWTNDRFRATRHRVINKSGKERMSVACFGNTNFHAMIECLPSCCSAENPARYPPVTSGEYLMDAVRRTYAYAS